MERTSRSREWWWRRTTEFRSCKFYAAWNDSDTCQNTKTIWNMPPETELNSIAIWLEQFWKTKSPFAEGFVYVLALYVGASSIWLSFQRISITEISLHRLWQSRCIVTCMHVTLKSCQDSHVRSMFSLYRNSSKHFFQNIARCMCVFNRSPLLWGSSSFWDTD